MASFVGLEVNSKLVNLNLDLVEFIERPLRADDPVMIRLADGSELAIDEGQYYEVLFPFVDTHWAQHASSRQSTVS